MDKHNATLPDGRSALLPLAQSRAVWQHWRGLMAVVLPRGEGVRIEVGDGVVTLSLVYAPQDEDGALIISGAGNACPRGGLPEYTPDPRPAPWEPILLWHVTWTGGGTSHGLASSGGPGYYPADEEEGRSADCVVAPIPADTPRGEEYEAVRKYAREQGWPCG